MTSVFGTGAFGSGVFPGGWQLGATSLLPDLMLEWSPSTRPTADLQDWEELTPRLREWSWEYGRSDELARFMTGEGHVTLDNRDRQLDPSHVASPWYGLIRMRRMFRLRSRWNSVEYPVFVAYAGGYPQAGEGQGQDATVTVPLADAFALMQRYDLVVGFTRPAEDTGARIAAVLDAVGVPAALRDLDAGTVEVQAIDVTQAGTSALDHAKSVAESEFGQLFVAKDGKVTFHNRHRRLNKTSAVTFSDNPAGAELPYAPGLTTEFDDNYLRNIVRVTVPDEDPVTAVDAASGAEHVEVVKEVPTVLDHSTDRQALAEYHLHLFADPVERVPTLPVTGQLSAAALWPVLLDLEISDRGTWEKYAATTVKTLIQNVEAIRHQGGVGVWGSALTVSPADARTYMVADDATSGVSDSVYLAGP